MASLSISVLASPFVATGAARAAGVPPCDIPGQLTPHPSNWYSIRVPALPNGSMTDYAVEPLAPNRLWVTDGITVMRTTDAGCHWSTVYELPAAGEPSASGAQILEIEVGGPGTVYLPIQRTEPVEKPHVVVTTDAGESWREADGPALGSIFGRIRDFDAALGNSAAAMLVDVELNEPGVVTVESYQTLFTTSDKGETWEPHVNQSGDLKVTVANGGVGIGGGEEMNGIAVNPLRSNEVWLYGPDSVAKYDGTTMLPTGLTGATLLDISFDGRAVIAYEEGTPVGHISLDGGVKWTELAAAVPVDSMDIISSAPLVVAMSSYGKVLVQYLPIGASAPALLEMSPLDQRGISDIQAAFPDRGERPSVYGRTATTIEVNHEPATRPFEPNEVTARIEPPPSLNKNNLSPPYKLVKMRPGQSETIPYQLALPAASTPLDVYFMIDISGSMQGTINGIRSAMQTIADRLRDTGIDVQFGVGSFRSYNDLPAYKRNLDIQPPGPPLATALNSLTASGGGDETQMAALLESVTGDGHATIPANENMHFRPGSLRVAIEVTDEPISQGGQHPTFQTVIDALLEHEVKQVGLAIQPPPLLGEHDYDNPGFGPAQGLIPVAKGSKAVAPAGGVDCDGDGDAELEEGDALVCLIDPAQAEEASLMADAIVHVLEAVQDIQDLAIDAGPAVDPSAHSEVVESVTPEILPQLDLKQANTGTFEVTVTCPHVPQTTLFPVRVSVSRPGASVAAAALDVKCVPVVDKKEPDYFPFPAFVPVAAVPPPPPRPPDPVPEPNPNPNPQQNPQAQAGFAAQKQHQPQVALAGQEAPAPDVAEEGSSEEFFMSDARQSRVPPVAFIFTTGAITAAGSYLLLARQRTQTAHAGNRRNRRR